MRTSSTRASPAACADFCTSEDGVRREVRAMPAEWQAVIAEQQQLMIGKSEFFDLREPWLFAPQGSRSSSAARPQRLVMRSG